MASSLRPLAKDQPPLSHKREQLTPKCQCWVSQLVLQPANLRSGPAANAFRLSDQNESQFQLKQPMEDGFLSLTFTAFTTVTSEYRAECTGSKAGGQRMRDSAFATGTRNLRQPGVISLGLDGPMIFTLHSQCQHN